MSTSEMSSLQLKTSALEKNATDPARSSFANLWAVVHKKEKKSRRLLREAEALVVLLKDEPEEAKKEMSVKDKIWQMGKELCENRPDDPKCDMFHGEEEDPEPPTPAAPSPTLLAPAPSAPAPSSNAPAPGASPPAPSPTASAPALAPAAAPSTAPSAPAASRVAQEQGFKGKDVQHIDGKTQTTDWHDEYEVPPPKDAKKMTKTPQPSKSGSWRAATLLFVAVPLAMCVAQPSD